MALHFSREELSQRRRNACRAMAGLEQDGLLLFRQESLYYLTGFDTFGYCFFQCLFLGADGAMTLLTRAPDLRQAQHTSVIDDIRIWVDGPEANPAAELRSILAEHGCRGAQLGVEWDTPALTAFNGNRLTAALDGFCTLVDASHLVSRLRLVKSEAEMAYLRQAAQLADAAGERGAAVMAPGADEADVLAEMQGAVFRGGGDYPANPFIIGSGRDALLCRYAAGRRRLDDEDQLTLEWAGVYRHYHACSMRTYAIGQPSLRHRELFAVASDALAASTAALLPGQPAGGAFEAHARVLDAAGLLPHRLNACGYSLGATFAPSWMDWPMLHAGNSVECTPGMVFFVHIIIADSDAGVAMTLGHTVAVGADGPEILTRPLAGSPMDGNRRMPYIIVLTLFLILAMMGACVLGLMG